MIVMKFRDRSLPDSKKYFVQTMLPIFASPNDKMTDTDLENNNKPASQRDNNLKKFYIETDVAIVLTLKYLTTTYLRNPNIKFEINENGKQIFKGNKGTWIIREDEPSTNKFITFDIETLFKKGKMFAYLICMYDGTTMKKIIYRVFR